MNYQLIGSGIGSVGLSLLLATAAQATPIEFGIFRSLTAPVDTNRCPDKVMVTEQARPYQEGGYTLDGTANLGWLADKFSLHTVDNFSITWVANLKRPYQNCQASGGMAKMAGEAFQGHSYLRLRFIDGKVYLILDMTGMRDANGFTTVIVKQGVRNGNPYWSWGGSD